jgi:lipopolysaccharide transport system ATP-binding protein
MNGAAIHVDGLGKAYRIGETARLNRTLGEAVGDALKAPMRRLRAGIGGGLTRVEPFWALRDISFAVRPGEVVGIIGRNGAGKTTLLKLLSRITDPTEGEAWINGRVASLLEVGTGFHPELTGRENIYFNGAILGMTRREIEARFDRIVAFADIGPFLDTPVKRYSSGMQVRLAFAVAAHLEPEILLIDEVLAVGDAAFQKKCLGKMEGVSRSGRTVLFISHNLAAVQQLCTRCIVLDRGRLLFDGAVTEGVATYLDLLREDAPSAVVDCHGRAVRRTTDVARITQMKLTDASGEPTTRIAFGAEFAVEVVLEVSRPVHDLSVGLGINSLDGVRLFTSESRATRPMERTEPGTFVFQLEWQDLVFRPGLYSIDVGHNSDAGSEYLPGVVQLEILDATDTHSRAVIDRRPGMVLNTMPWSVHAEPYVAVQGRPTCV